LGIIGKTFKIPGLGMNAVNTTSPNFQKQKTRKMGIINFGANLSQSSLAPKTADQEKSELEQFRLNMLDT
jgi:hypothetical protein